jgi:hypothetical protein
MNQSFHDELSDSPAGASGQGAPRRGSLVWTLLAGGLWLSVVVTGLALVFIYTNTPSRAMAAPVDWPAKSRIDATPSLPTLIMFAHPHCPCTRASLGELEQLMSDCRGRLTAQVWFIKPLGTDTDWTNTDLWTTAARIPGVTVHCDENGVEAQRFHAETSGESLLYDQGGRLLFQGGITIARGHFGDNAGLSVVENRVNHKTSDLVKTPVFGCSLFDTECQTNQGGIAWKQ